ncbi:MAG: DUF4870 domain-containing protein [Ignavibacteria bacterium]|nr:DUF4870 domain-containing protein [Ignavibacteria bacterium]
MENNTNTPTSDERLLALLSHLSVLFGGIILPIILWAVQKDKSQFVRFHSLQAIFYHLVYLCAVLIFVIALVFFVIFFGVSLGAITSRHHNDPGAFPALIIGLTAFLYLGIFVIIFAFIGYGVYLGVKAYGGHYIKIPVIGKIIYEKIIGRQ